MRRRRSTRGLAREGERDHRAVVCRCVNTLIVHVRMLIDSLSPVLRDIETLLTLLSNIVMIHLARW